LSFRDVEELMAARGILVSYETIRRWCEKFGAAYAAGLRRRRARTGDKWHLDEVFLKINGITHYLWRAVDQNGVVLDILVQPKRDRFAAMRFFRRLLRAIGHKPRVIITDKLRSYAAAKRIVMPGVAHRQHRYLNNRAENSHQPTRERERRMPRFKSGEHAQRFVEVHGMLPLTFVLDAICSPPRIIESSAVNAFTFGTKCPARRHSRSSFSSPHSSSSCSIAPGPS